VLDLISDLSFQKLTRHTTCIRVIFDCLKFLLLHATFKWEMTEHRVYEFDHMPRRVSRASYEEIADQLQYHSVKYKIFQDPSNSDPVYSFDFDEIDKFITEERTIFFKEVAKVLESKSSIDNRLQNRRTEDCLR
jgi:hypothetical protein